MQSTEQRRLLADVESFCQELREHEELCYVEHRFNHHLLPLAQKYNILGMPVPTEFGGRGADTVTYAKALVRIGQEGTGVRTFFSGHTSIGQYPIMTWGSEEQKRRYLPASCKGEKILAFGLTEPDAGSNPLEMTTTYEKQGRSLRAQRHQISHLQRRHRQRHCRFRLSEGAPSPPAGGARSAHFVIDRRSSPGIEREDLLAKVGMPTANTGMFSLTDYQCPLANLLGPEGDGFRIAMGTLVSGRLERCRRLSGRHRGLPDRIDPLRQGTPCSTAKRSANISSCRNT